MDAVDMVSVRICAVCIPDPPQDSCDNCRPKPDLLERDSLQTLGVSAGCEKVDNAVMYCWIDARCQRPNSRKLPRDAPSRYIF